jgi:hypothetical protein
VNLLNKIFSAIIAASDESFIVRFVIISIIIAIASIGLATGMPLVAANPVVLSVIAIGVASLFVVYTVFKITVAFLSLNSSVERENDDA